MGAIIQRLGEGFLLIFLWSLSAGFTYAEELNKQIKYPDFKPFGYVHLWALNDRTPGANFGDDYMIARARIGAKGNLNAMADYMILTEWGRLTLTDPVTLLDAWVNYKFDPRFNIRTGQTWYKFTLSGAAPLPTIPFIARPDVIDAIWLPMGRNGSYSYDKGIELWGDFNETKLPWGYAFSVTSGTGVKRFADNKPPDFVGRVCVGPYKGFKLGASGFYGWSRVEITSNLGRGEDKNIPEYAYGLDLSYNHKYFRVISETVQSLYEGYLDVSGAEGFRLDTKKQRGWYAMFGLKPLPWIEFPVQYAWYESNYVNSDTGLETITLGLTWWLKENSLNNIKINYLIRNAQKNFGSKPRNKFIVQVQLAF